MPRRERDETPAPPPRAPSLWARTAPERARSDTLPGDVDVDVAIVGAGIVGLTVGVVAAERGLDVAVLEARRVGAGTSGATTGKFSVQNGAKYHELRRRHGLSGAQAYADAARAGIERVERLVSHHRISCGLERSASQLAVTTEDGRRMLQREAAAAAAVGVRTRWGATMSDHPIAARAVLTFDAELQVHPTAYLFGLADAVVQAGGRLYEDCRVTGLRSTPEGTWAVDVGEREVRARHVVVATRLPSIGDHQLTFARATPVGAAVIAGTVATPLPSTTALVVGADATWSVRASRWPAGEDHLVVVGPDVAWPRGPRTSSVVERWASAHWPDLEVSDRWFAQDQRPADGRPLIGRLRDRGVWTATGFGKWGLALGTYAAEVVVAGIVGDTPPAGAGFFRMSRRPGAHAARDLVVDNAAVATRWVSARLPHRGQPSPLEAGQGRVQRQGRTLVAEARGPDGRLHRVDARCTHLGCPVSWNAVETTWDCRCHGARFAIDGAVLEAPATEPLTPLEHDDRGESTTTEEEPR